MLKRILNRMKKQNGSATVEAVLAFVGFLFVIFTILGMVNFCRAQMLVSSAVDTVARELSQYAYFYQMSGLQKFDKGLENQKDVGKENINEIIGTVDSFYSSLGNAVEGTSKDMANLADVTTKGTLKLQDIETVITNIDTNGTNIANSITSMGNAFERIGDDPLLYMRSLVAIAGHEGMELAKRAIASSLAKMFIKKHFGDSWEEANARLENLGIVDGLDGMNFNLSTLFSDQDKEDIEIVVFYKVKLLQVLDWQMIEANISKRAVCRAWLGGDDVQERVKPESEGIDLGEPMKPPEEETKPAEGEIPTEETSEPETVDTTGSLWYLGDGGYGGQENAGVTDAFMKKFKQDYNIAPDDISGHLVGFAAERDSKNQPTNTVHQWHYDSSPSPSDFDLTFVTGMLDSAQRAMEKGTISENTQIVNYVLYVPENMPADEQKALREAASKAQLEYRSMIMQNPETKIGDFVLGIDIIPAGGNYDYTNGG